ncbi:MAG: hypothetical protein JWR02_1442 [Mucilaginibacter sp.]|nr:hypothetical protein [Mucilaginibacter sp.]
MDKLTFKNYHPSVLVFLICLIVALNFEFKILWETILGYKMSGLLEQPLIIITSSSIVLGALNIFNRYCKWLWLLNLLGLTDTSGNYAGVVTSSYYMDDDPAKGHIKLFSKLQIVQNINAIKIEGEFFTDEDFTNRSSYFISSEEEIRKKPNGDFIITYFFANRGNQLHPDDKKYSLNNHDGIGVLTYSPMNHTLKGYYFNHQRFSNGEINLELQSKIL